MASMNSLNGKGKQVGLFDADLGIAPELVNNGHFAFSDPAFAVNKTLPIHRWVPWTVEFSSIFVRNALDRYLDHKGTVLDPFAGVGTTLIEAALSGHDVIGFELNPYAALACRMKLASCLIKVDDLKKKILEFKAFFEEKITSDYTPVSVPPEGFKTGDDFYSPKVLHKVLIVQDFIDTIRVTILQDLFKLVFAATMVSYSNGSNAAGQDKRVSNGKDTNDAMVDFPVLETFSGKLAIIVEDIAWFQRQLAGRELHTSVVADTFFAYSKYVKPQSVDLIITSPPYLNNHQYNQNTSPQLYWLGYVEKPQDFHALENANFGKYWQTVHEQEYLGLDFSLPGTDIAERLQQLRLLHPEKKIYGGNGWANYAASYFNDCHRFAVGIHYCLKHGGTALVVLGTSMLQGLPIPTDYYFGKIAESVGLELVEIHVPRATHAGSSSIQSSDRVTKAEDSHQLYEAVIELRKK